MTAGFSQDGGHQFGWERVTEEERERELRLVTLTSLQYAKPRGKIQWELIFKFKNSIRKALNGMFCYSV